MTPDPVHERIMMEAKAWGWKRELLVTRIRDLNDAKMRAFTVDGIFYGSSPSVRELIGKAIHCHEIDELEYCEDHCEAAEAAIIRDSQHLVNVIEPSRKWHSKCLPGWGRA